MSRNTTYKVLLSTLGVALLGITLAGCGNNATDTAATTPDAASAVTQEDSGTTAPAEIAALFPSATLTKKAFPLSDSAAAHMSEGTGLKFSGDEKEWEIHEATQEGQRVGFAVMTHSDLPDGGDMHVTFAVDNKFVITQAVVSDAPDEAKLNTFVAQTVGMTYGAAFKAGKDLKAPTDLSTEVAQAAADAVHKGVLILEENFNPLHGEKEGHDEDSHADDGHGH